MSVVIRRADIAESDAIAELFRETRESALPFLPILHTLDEDHAYFRGKVFQENEIWVARDGSLLGFIAFHEDWIGHLYVHPAHHGSGYGRALTAFAQENYSPLSLWLFQKNLKAAAFYERMGFRKVEETDGSGNEEMEPDMLYRWSR